VRVFVAEAGSIISPFNDPAKECQILGQRLADSQKDVFETLGLELVDSEPEGEEFLLVSSRTWFTAQTIVQFLKVATAGSRLKIEDELFCESSASLQDLPEEGLYEIGLIAPGARASFEGLAPVVIDARVERKEAPKEHPALMHAMPRELPFTDVGVHQIDHWSHILRANWMAISCGFAREHRKFKRRNIVSKVFAIVCFLLKARSISKWKLARALSVVGKKSSIHPTAVVEASVIGEGVEIGPYAVVRGSFVGDGCKIEEHTTVNASVLGKGAKVGRFGMANLSVLYDGAFVGAANGYQASVIGEGAFLAWSVTVFDLSFGDHVKVQHRGERVSSGSFFLGAAIGHRARIGAQVSLGYGTEVPNDSFLVGSAQDVMRSWEEGEGPHRVVSGVATPVSKK
jgi:NDP-sugar pyrophosphorylase family protein